MRFPSLSVAKFTSKNHSTPFLVFCAVGGAYPPFLGGGIRMCVQHKALDSSCLVEFWSASQEGISLIDNLQPGTSPIRRKIKRCKSNCCHDNTGTKQLPKPGTFEHLCVT